MKALILPTVGVAGCAILWPWQMLLIGTFLAFVTIGSSLLTDWLGRRP